MVKAGYIICDIERDIREINNNITNKNKLSILNKTLIEQKKLHAILEKNFYGKLEYMKNHMKKCFQKYVLDLNYNRCYIDQLSTRTHLISLLDDFSTSQKDFLVLKNQFRMPFTNNYISLIITYYYPGLDVIKIQPTMTELKKEQGKYVNQLTVDRLEPLKNTLLSLNQNNLKDGVVYTFDTPFMLGGQTSRNRQGYGNRWFGPNDYIEGTYYGEVTDFMISGFIMNSLFFNIQNKKEQDRIKEKSTKQINKTTKKHINTLKVFPKLLMENILSLCIEQYLNPIEVINKAIKRTEEENLNDFNFDKTILKTFNKYLNPYKEEYDYLVYLIYEVSKQLNCSIIKIISLSKESKSTIIKKF